MFSGGMERYQWYEMGEQALATNYYKISESGQV